MSKFFDKSKSYNYITAGIFLIVAVMFIKNMSSFIWNFNIFSKHQLFLLMKNIVNGKIFSSGKQLSFLITFIGTVLVTFSGVLIAMQLSFNEDFKTEKNIENDNQNLNEKAEISNTEIEEKVDKNLNKVKEDISTIIPRLEEKFAMYNENQNKDLKVENTTERVENNISEEPEALENEEERIKLQNKIKEIMKKMKEKSEPEAETENSKSDKNEEKSSKKLLSKFEIPEVINAEKTEKIDMNFKNISEEENIQMEHTLISAGFKLLSEIRIGSTGIDYLGVAKDKLAIVQLDTTDGNWFASEDMVEGNKTPVWFSEFGNKISPVSRTIEAKNNIEQLLVDTKLPIETVVCLTNSNIVNYEEYAEKWDKMGIKIVKLNEKEEDIGNNIKTLDDIYPMHSQEAISEELMNKIISILENAEIPE